MNDIDREELVKKTEEYGKQWGINHTRRLLHLIGIIGKGLEYDHDAVWVASHLHDWGAYAPWARDGVDHAKRSVEVAADFLAERNYPPKFTALVLECIANHHGASGEGSIESVLLSDADGLDFLGIVGMLRDISKNPKDLRKGYETAKMRRETVPPLLRLDKSQALAAERIRQMDELFSLFEQDSFGCY